MSLPDVSPAPLQLSAAAEANNQQLVRSHLAIVSCSCTVNFCLKLKVMDEYAKVSYQLGHSQNEKVRVAHNGKSGKFDADASDRAGRAARTAS